MPMPIENSYVQIGSDTTRFWATARVQYVPAGDATMAAWLASGRQVVLVGSEADITETLVNLGLGNLAPIPQPPPPPSPFEVLQQALMSKGVLTQADLNTATATLAATPAPVSTPPTGT